MPTSAGDVDHHGAAPNRRSGTRPKGDRDPSTDTGARGETRGLLPSNTGRYHPQKTHFWKGTEELERFPPAYAEQNEAFEVLEP